MAKDLLEAISNKLTFYGLSNETAFEASESILKLLDENHIVKKIQKIIRNWQSISCMEYNTHELLNDISGVFSDTIPVGKEIAKKLMLDIMFGNEDLNQEGFKTLDPEWIEKIAPIAENFFKINPELFSDDALNEIAIADWTIISTKYKSLKGFQELNKILNDFFSDL